MFHIDFLNYDQNEILSISRKDDFSCTFLGNNRNYFVYRLKTLFSGIGVENPTFATKIKKILVRPRQIVCLFYVSKLIKMGAY